MTDIVTLLRIMHEEGVNHVQDAADEIERLREQLAECRESNKAVETALEEVEYSGPYSNGVTVLRDEIYRLRAEIHDLLGKVDECQKDADRYRHMRGNAAFQNRNGPGLYWYLPRFNQELPVGERLDAAIDAAMKNLA